MSDEPSLVRRARAGDTTAFDTIVRRRKRAVYGYVLARTHDPAWADDLAQETFVAAFIGLGRLRDPERFGAWLFGIAEKIAALWLRRTERATHTIARGEPTERDEFALDRAHDRNAPRDADAAVLRAVSALSPANAAAVALYYGDRLPQAECAAFLGISLKAFESRLSRAREQLKKEFLAMTGETLDRHAPGDEFADAVAAEIRRLVDILGGPYRKAPVAAAEERLRALFQRNEDRLADLIRGADRPGDRRAAMRMVLALGPTGVRRALSLALADDEWTRRNALAAIPTAIESDETAGTHVYLVLEAIHDADFPDAEKIGVLIELVRRSATLADLVPKATLTAYRDDAPFYAEMLMTFGDAAARRLLAEIRSDAVAGHDRSLAMLLPALARHGTAGVEPALAFLDDPDERVVIAGIDAARALGESRYWVVEHLSAQWWPHLPDRDVPLLARVHPRPVVQPSRVDDAALTRIGARIASAMLGHPSRDVRLAAARALGYYPDDVGLNPLAHVLFGADAEIAAEAANSLGWVWSAARVEPLVRVLEDGPAVVKRLAFRAIRQFVTGYAHNLPTLRNRKPDELLPPFRNALATAEALLEAVMKRRERIIAARVKAAADPDLSAKERAELGDKGIWNNPYFFEKLDAAKFRAEREMATAETRERRIRLAAEHREQYPEGAGSIASWPERKEQMERRWAESGFRERVEQFHRAHPEASATFRRPRPFFHVNLAAVVRELPEDRIYTEKEMLAASARANGDHALARRRLYEDWWMGRDGRTYTFTDRGRRAWRMERVLVGEET